MLLGHEAAGIVEQVGGAVPDLHRRAAGRDDVPAALRAVFGVRHRRAGAVRSPAAPPTARAPCSAVRGGCERRTSAPPPRGVRLRHPRRGRPPFGGARGRRRARGGRLAARVRRAHRWRRGLNAGRPRAGQTVAVVGLGGVGMAAVLTALAHDDVHGHRVDQLADKLDAGAGSWARTPRTPPRRRASGSQGRSGDRGRRAPARRGRPRSH